MKSVLNVVIGVLAGLLLAGLIWLVARAPGGQSVALRPPPTEALMVVHVVGAVPRPGVYKLPPGSRVQDAVDAAGGFLAEADKNGLNRARLLQDGEQLSIPFLAGREPTPVSPEYVELININTASVEELETLPGVGPTLAENIVSFREINGPFMNVEDILQVSGMGPSIFDEIKDLITVGE